MEFHLKWNVKQMEFYTNYNVTPIKSHLIWNFIQFGMSLKLECHLNWNVPQILMLLKLKCNSNWNVTSLECHSNMMSLKLEDQID